MKRALIIFALALVACAHVTRDEVLSRTMAGLEAADKAFVAKDDAIQMEIVAKADNEGEGRNALQQYRVGPRAKVVVAFTVAYTAVATASIDLSEASLTQLVHAAAEAIAAFKTLDGGTP